MGLEHGWYIVHTTRGRYFVEAEDSYDAEHQVMGDTEPGERLRETTGPYATNREAWDA